MSLPTKKPVNYLNNKDILKEIHASKNTYCSYDVPEYNQYDMIIDLPSEDKLEKSLEYACRDDTIQQAKEARADREKIDIESIKKTDIIYRIMTWDHIPVAPKQPRKVVKPKTAKEIFEFEEEPVEILELGELDAFDDPELDKEMGMNDMVHVRLNFPPFQHFKFDDNDCLVCVGKSHWKDNQFSKDHGQITNKLAKMYLMLCEKYALRFNWRNYCVDESTEALTNRGWLSIDEITTNDKILSYHEGKNVWSDIKSIFRNDYDDLMFHLTSRSYDTLITPNHKIVTDRGLIPIELIKEKDRFILMGDEVCDTEKKHDDSYVELIGWIVTEGCYEYDKKHVIKNIGISQKIGIKADRIRNCLNALQLKYTERTRANDLIHFRIWKESSIDIWNKFPEKNLTMKFILELSSNQRLLLIESMIDADGWRRGKHRSYVQKCQKHTDIFTALCAISGIRTTTHRRNHISFGKNSECNNINLLSKRNNVAMAENIDFHGAKRNGQSYPGLGKSHHPNVPTVHYKGRIWCPQTEYGCFMARRNGNVYLTGNTYVDEMRASAVLQLTYVGLRFNESRSKNPFAYYTTAIKNSFRRVLNMEKRNQNIRDDILQMNNLNPSWSRQYNESGHDD